MTHKQETVQLLSRKNLQHDPVEQKEETQGKEKKKKLPFFHFSSEFGLSFDLSPP